MSQKRRQQEVIDHGKKNQKKCKYKKMRMHPEIRQTLPYQTG